METNCRYCGRPIGDSLFKTVRRRDMDTEKLTYEYYHVGCEKLFVYNSGSLKVLDKHRRHECHIIKELSETFMLVDINGRAFIIPKANISILVSKCEYYNGMIQVDLPDILDKQLELCT